MNILLNAVTATGAAASSIEEFDQGNNLFLYFIVGLWTVVVMALVIGIIASSNDSSTIVEGSIIVAAVLVLFVALIFAAPKIADENPSPTATQETQETVPSPDVTPSVEEPKPSSDAHVAELQDLLTDEFGVTVDEPVLAQAAGIVRDSGVSQKIVGKDAAGESVVVTVFSAVDPDVNPLSVSVSAP